MSLASNVYAHVQDLLVVNTLVPVADAVIRQVSSAARICVQLPQAPDTAAFTQVMNGVRADARDGGSGGT